MLICNCDKFHIFTKIYLMKKLITLIISIAIIFQACENENSKEENIQNDKENYIEFELEQLAKVSTSDSLESLSNEFLSINKKITTEEKARFHSQLGVLYYRLSDLQKADTNFHISQIAYAIIGDSSRFNHLKMNRAAMNEMMGNFDRAVNIYMEVIEFFKRKQDSLQLANSYSNLGVAYEAAEDAPKSIEYHKKALALRRAKNDTINIGYSLNNIGVVFTEILDNKDSAIFYYLQANDIFKNTPALWESATVSSNIGHIYVDFEEYEKARNYFEYSFKIYDSINLLQGEAEMLRSFGQLDFAEGNDESAIDYLQRSLKLNEDAGNLKEVLEIKKILAQVYISRSNYIKAVEINEDIAVLSDSILNIDKLKAIADVETKYEVKEKDKTIQLLKLQDELRERQTNIQILLIVSLFLLVTLLVVVYSYKSKQNKMKQEQLRLELQNYILIVDELQLEKENNSDSTKFEEAKIAEYNLSEREKDVLQMIAAGYKNSEIADKLFVSQNTVKTHIKNIYIKLDVKNRIEALKRVQIIS